MGRWSWQFDDRGDDINLPSWRGGKQIPQGNAGGLIKIIFSTSFHYSWTILDTDHPLLLKTWLLKKIYWIIVQNWDVFFVTRDLNLLTCTMCIENLLLPTVWKGRLLIWIINVKSFERKIVFYVSKAEMEQTKYPICRENILLFLSGSD